MSEITIEIDDAGHRRRVGTTKPLILIGRSAQCDVQLTSPQVSARHARLRVYQDSIVLEDLNSSNGVLLDGARLTAPRSITPESRIQLGSGGPTLRLCSGAVSVVVAPPSQPSGARGSTVLFAGLAVGCLVVSILGAATAGMVALLVMRSGAATVRSLSQADLAPSVGLVIVGLSTKHSPPKFLPLGTGTAFAVTSDGVMLTNRHVVEGVRDGSAVPQEYRETGAVAGVHVWVAVEGALHPADICYVSGENDLAILKIDRKNMRTFRLSSNDDVDHLTRVFAVGFPGAASVALSDEEKFEEQIRKSDLHDNIRLYFKDREFEYTLTDGTVSRMSKESNGRSWIQHSAIISQGNSGGPLCLEDATVVGINTQGVMGADVRQALCVGQLRREIETVTQDALWTR